ncbi:hypothetical protein [Pontibacillus litoralis]|uniref:Uncharacterized protein n=1 Tax=Pontibacillus litoralis JSM 072002 TaxID=1385512 RepID=A0A0A5HZ45_9BACI|nr:hypothetical protein [Pontibacillus litoralis]KGX88882.1 hypothetical protein N784_00625 [Pontibacillus litoralis JSM 072002]
MTYTFLTLFVVSIALYLLSFPMKSKIKDLEQQIDQLSLRNLQDNYQLKKKIKVIEEELLINDWGTNLTSSNKVEMTNTSAMAETMNQAPLVNKVLHMFENGYTTAEIAQATSLKEHDILTTLKQYSTKEFN